MDNPAQTHNRLAQRCNQAGIANLGNIRQPEAVAGKCALGVGGQVVRLAPGERRIGLNRIQYMHAALPVFSDASRLRFDFFDPARISRHRAQSQSGKRFGVIPRQQGR